MKIKYSFTLKHDAGTAKVHHVTWKNELNLESAIESILNYECCPRSAIKKIEIKFYE